MKEIFAIDKGIAKGMGEFEKEIKEEVEKIREGYHNGLKHNTREKNGFTYAFNNGVLEVYREEDKKKDYMYIHTFFFNSYTDGKDGGLRWLYQWCE